MNLAFEGSAGQLPAGVGDGEGDGEGDGDGPGEPDGEGEGDGAGEAPLHVTVKFPFASVEIAEYVQVFTPPTWFKVTVAAEAIGATTDDNPEAIPTANGKCKTSFFIAIPG
jgi:hypothetical protein